MIFAVTPREDHWAVEILMAASDLILNLKIFQDGRLPKIATPLTAESIKENKDFLNYRILCSYLHLSETEMSREAIKHIQFDNGQKITITAIPDNLLPGAIKKYLQLLENGRIAPQKATTIAPLYASGKILALGDNEEKNQEVRKQITEILLKNSYVRYAIAHEQVVLVPLSLEDIKEAIIRRDYNQIHRLVFKGVHLREEPNPGKTVLKFINENLLNEQGSAIEEAYTRKYVSVKAGK